HPFGGRRCTKGGNIGLPGKAGQSLGRSDGRFGHGQGFEHLVLDAPGYPQRRYGDRRLGEVGPDVRDWSHYSNPVYLGQFADRGHGPPTHKLQVSLRKVAINLGPDFATEPASGIDIGVVIQSADEDTTFLGTWGRRRSKVIEIDAVGKHVQLVPGVEAA